jgi:hypothetical protein
MGHHEGLTTACGGQYRLVRNQAADMVIAPVLILLASEWDCRLKVYAAGIRQPALGLPFGKGMKGEGENQVLTLLS